MAALGCFVWICRSFLDSPAAAQQSTAVAVAPVAATSRLLAPTAVSQGRARPRSASPAVSSARGRSSVGGAGGASVPSVMGGNGHGEGFHGELYSENY